MGFSVGPVRLGVVRAGDVITLSGFGRPFGLAWDREERLYVVDLDLHALFRFSGDLGVVETLAPDGSGWIGPWEVERRERPQTGPHEPGFLNGPHCVDFDDDGRLYVTTYYDPAIHVLSPGGRPERSVGAAGSKSPLEGPATALFGADGLLYVSEFRKNLVIAYSRAGNIEKVFGGGGTASPDGYPSSSKPGWFDRVHMARRLSDGSLVAVDTWNHRLQRFAADGRFLGWLGAGSDGVRGGWRDDNLPAKESDAPGGMRCPISVEIDEAADEMLVPEWGNGRVQRFGLDGRHRGFVPGLDLDRPYDARRRGNALAVTDTHRGRVIIQQKGGL